MQTDLKEHLDRLGTKHLVLAWMTANLCVESTGRHATELGYDVTFVSDAIGAESLPAYEASIHVNFPLIANAVLEVDEFLGSIAATPGGAEQAVRPGDTLYGSDRGQIGTVEDVVPASDGGPGYVLVQRGVIFEKELFVPSGGPSTRSWILPWQHCRRSSVRLFCSWTSTALPTQRPQMLSACPRGPS